MFYKKTFTPLLRDICIFKKSLELIEIRTN